MDFNINNFLSSSLGETLGGSLMRALTAILVLIIGMMIAKFISGLVRKGINSTGVQNRFGNSSFNIAKSVAKIVYWVLLIFVLLTVLNMMGVTGALEPLQNMIGQITGYLPKILAGGVIGFVGYTLASICREAVGMAEPGVDRLVAKAGMTNDFDVMGILKQIVFIVVLVPIVLIALDTLDIEMISEPAKNMLNKLMNAIPNIIAAAITLFVFSFVGRFIKNFLLELLDNLKLDSKVNGLGIGNVIPQNQSVASIVSNVVYYLILVFGLMTAVDYLGFDKLSSMFDTILDLTGRIIFGGVILLIGNAISTFVARQLEGGDKTVAQIARVATMALFMAIGLRYMGIADDIVNLAFGLILGALAVAFALAFGLGGREAAGEQARRFFNKFNK